MGIGEVVKGFKEGKIYCREGWNGKNMFVCSQVPAHVDENIIPKMSSLNDMTKYALMKTIKEIFYCSQMLIINLNTHKADSWVPSSSDLLAKDWMEITKEMIDNGFFFPDLFAKG